MANKWIQFVKYFAKQKGISYIKAMTDEDIKADYKAWKAGDIEYITPKPKAKKVVEEEEFEYIIPAPKKPKAKKVVEEEEFEYITPAPKKSKAKKVIQKVESNDETNELYKQFAEIDKKYANLPKKSGRTSSKTYLVDFDRKELKKYLFSKYDDVNDELNINITAPNGLKYNEDDIYNILDIDTFNPNDDPYELYNLVMYLKKKGKLTLTKQ